MLIQLYHKNKTNGTHGGAWVAEAGQTVGPLRVGFETGPGAFGIMDYWWINVIPMRDSLLPARMTNTGPSINPGWKECQLQHSDAGQTLNFAVDKTTSRSR